MEAEYERSQRGGTVPRDWVRHRPLLSGPHRIKITDGFSEYRFGTPYHDGYGINCASSPISAMIGHPLNDFADLSGPNLIKFGIESKFSCAETSTSTFQRAITSALREMRQVCSPEPIHRDTPAVARL